MEHDDQEVFPFDEGVLYTLYRLVALMRRNRLVCDDVDSHMASLTRRVPWWSVVNPGSMMSRMAGRGLVNEVWLGLCSWMVGCRHVLTTANVAV